MAGLHRPLLPHKLWEAAGMPKDKDEEFWHAAEQELLNEDIQIRIGRLSCQLIV